MTFNTRISATKRKEGEAPNITYSWIITAADLPLVDGTDIMIISKYIDLEIPEGCQASSGWNIRRVDCGYKDPNQSRCYLVIDGQPDPACVYGFLNAVRLPGDTPVDEVRANIERIIAQGMQLSMPTRIPGERELIPIQVSCVSADWSEFVNMAGRNVRDQVPCVDALLLNPANKGIDAGAETDELIQRILGQQAT